MHCFQSLRPNATQKSELNILYLCSGFVRSGGDVCVFLQSAKAMELKVYYMILEGKKYNLTTKTITLEYNNQSLFAGWHCSELV